ncbi:MAG: type II CRISPR RNA-guided endonuclease Cas9 [Bacteroidales bacterium]|nr:type II CRISPR RNA-guided endonuclease Cas9 [Bacteroidales bacterium]
MKKILGLDLGTNSIGWAVIKQKFDKKIGEIEGVGSRIIPMSQDILGKFDSGVSISQTAERTGYRGVRRLYQRDNLRRERLHRVLNVLNFLPKHYKNSIDFEQKLGQFKELNEGEKETKLNYKKNDDGKYEFIFMDAFNDMLNEFKLNGQETKIPLDWTLYYLRKKALSQKIAKEELAWIILNFNQKRGYYQLRGEETENDENKDEKFYSLKVIRVKATDGKNEKGTWYEVILENDWIYKRQSKTSLADWVGKEKEFIITTKKNKDGSIKRSFRAPKEDDWKLIKKKTEQEIEQSGKYICEYIYDTLLQNPTQKIRGKLIKTIERKFYKKELEKIIDTQIKLHNELKNKKLYNDCIEELYPRNEAHKSNIKEKGFKYLFINDIIFYQRPLKSKKSTISGCQYESRIFKKKTIDSVTGKEKEEWVNDPLKVISKSHPLFQEFRLWQFLKNLKIYQKELVENGKTQIDVDVTEQFLKTEDEWVKLFDFLNTRKEIEQKQIIQYFVSEKIITKKEKDNYRWNYVEDKKYPCNETKAQFISRLKKVKDIDVENFLTYKKELNLWHIIYSVKDKNEYEKAIENFAIKNNIDRETFIENFKKFPPFKNEYGAYSEKAIKKLLPLMKRGKYWNENETTKEIKERVNSIIERLKVIGFDKQKIDNNITDDDIPKQLLKSFIDFKDKNPLQALNTYQACYAVYNRHSEVSEIQHWKVPKDIDKYLSEFKQHSLRNPIVEQVVTETLRVVRDIWKKYGDFDEIHVELGREMKNPADKRKQMTQRVTENENTNYRIKELLKELVNDPKTQGEVRPYSPNHQEILKIYEEGIYQYDENIDEGIEKIRKKSSLSKSDINKYKLWLEQGYNSPYTGKAISLSRLFTTDYQIEHIIPQSRYFDNSLSNKIICESEVNAIKSNQTAYEFIKNHGSEKVNLGNGNTVEILKLAEYENHCNKYFKKNRTKLKKLLSEDIPEGFIERQLNDTRYISKLVKGLLSNIVREEGEKEATSKNLISVTGTITSKLKQDWGLNNKWNEIIAPRFKRLNELTNSDDFGYWDKKINTFRTQVPDNIAKGFNKKRIDHRHHALDALAIACTNRKHIQYLNSLSNEKQKYELQPSILTKNKEGHYTKHFLMPWKTFTTDAKEQLEKTIISFKQNLRVINKTNNKTWQWVKQKNGKYKKLQVKQTKGENWAIRKPMHKETVSGKVSIREIKRVSFNQAIDNNYIIVEKKLNNKIKKLRKQDYDNAKIKTYFKKLKNKFNDKDISKVEVYYFIEATASRVSLSDIKTLKHIEKITDKSIQNILKKHIKNYLSEDGEVQFDLAFSPEGIGELNKNIVELNKGKQHNPIYKVRLYEEGNKFNVGYSEHNKNKYVEAAKGTNLFFAIYETENKKGEKIRSYETIPLNEVIEHQKQNAYLPNDDKKPIPINSEKGTFLFSLSPNDLVYVPTDEEIEDPSLFNIEKVTKEQINRIYKMVSSSGSQCFFIKNEVANTINDKEKKRYEFSSLNKMEKDIKGNMIKDICWKLKVNRLGEIIGYKK